MIRKAIGILRKIFILVLMLASLWTAFTWLASHVPIDSSVYWLTFGSVEGGEIVGWSVHEGECWLLHSRYDEAGHSIHRCKYKCPPIWVPLILFAAYPATVYIKGPFRQRKRKRDIFLLCLGLGTWLMIVSSLVVRTMLLLLPVRPSGVRLPTSLEATPFLILFGTVVGVGWSSFAVPLLRRKPLKCVATYSVILVSATAVGSASLIVISPIVATRISSSLLVFWLPSAVFLAACVVLWQALPERHPSGHCQKCGYNLTGDVSGVCPECGTEVEKP